MPTAAQNGIRRCRKLLRAVGELHVRGFQRVRIVPSLYNLGTWRCSILPACHISKEHGARWARDVPDDAIARYSSASGSTFWGWQDVSHAHPSELADVILERFPRIAQLGYGQDWAYAGWYLHMLDVTYPDALPISWNDQTDDGDYRYVLKTIGRDVTIPLPPPGHATHE